MMRRSLFLLVLVFPALSGCDWLPPGKPQLYEKWKSPSENNNFLSLYAQNCMACHGNGENLAPVLPLDNPQYLSLIPQATMRSVIANGIPGTSMPAFAKNNGGPLDDKQLDILVAALYSARTNAAPAASAMPPYSAPLGDPARGAQVYATYCASCHGVDGKGGTKGGSVVDSTYLDLVSDQYLRTIVIVGRPDLGMPDWKNNAPGKVMSNQDISDVVAWLASHRLISGTSAQPVSPLPTPTAP